MVVRAAFAQEVARMQLSLLNRVRFYVFRAVFSLSLSSLLPQLIMFPVQCKESQQYTKARAPELKAKGLTPNG